MSAPPQFDERLAVWTALSELYLDTQLTPQDIDGIVNILLTSAYSADELDHILRDEVAPAFSSNLLSVAGEWTFWDQDEVRQIMVRVMRDREGSVWERLRFKLRPRIVPSEWPSILSRISAVAS